VSIFKYPLGFFSIAGTLKSDLKAPEASIRAVMKKFDFGVLVRRANPKAEMGGLINLDVDLKGITCCTKRISSDSS
jgi:hypothetical protein